MSLHNRCMETDCRGHCIDDTIRVREIGKPPGFNPFEIHCLHQFGCQIHGNCGAFVKHHGDSSQKTSYKRMKLVVQVTHPSQKTACTLINTDKRPQKSPQLEVFFVVKQRDQPGGFCKHLSECGRDAEAALDQVSNAEHSYKSLNAVRDTVVFVVLATSVPRPVFAYEVH